MSKKFRKGSYLAMTVMAIHQLAGTQAIMLQTNDIISQMKGFALTPREGTILIGFWNFFAASCSLYSAKAFSRRTMLAGGHTLIGIFLILFGLLNQLGKPTYAFGAMLGFLFVVQTTDTAVTWLYCTEVAVDVALGFVGVFGYFLVFLITYSIKPMEDSFLGLAGTFYVFGAD